VVRMILVRLTVVRLTVVRLTVVRMGFLDLLMGFEVVRILIVDLFLVVCLIGDLLGLGRLLLLLLGLGLGLT